MSNKQKIGTVILFMPIIAILIAGMFMEDTRPIAIATSLVIITITTSIVGATMIFTDNSSDD